MKPGGSGRRSVWAAVSLGASALCSAPARADEAGASAWLPGQFASFAAEASDPGFALETIYYTRSASASANRTFPIGASLAAGYTLNETYVFVTPSYTFSDPVLNGQLWLGATFAVGHAATSVSAVLSAPFATLSASSSDWMTGVGDINPLAMLRSTRRSAGRSATAPPQGHHSQPMRRKRHHSSPHTPMIRPSAIT